MNDLKLGRLPRRFDPRVPHMSALISGAPQLPPAPAVDWTKGLPLDLSMMLNNELGDCTCAAYYHAIQVWSAQCNPGHLVITEADSDVLELYQGACGYVVGNPSTDNGGDEQSVLTYLLNTGAPTGLGATRHKLAGFVELDVRNTDDVKRAIEACGVVYIGFSVPTFVMGDGTPPQVWDLEPSADNSIEGGHAVAVCGYDDQAVKLISWGEVYQMTWPFWAQFVDEAYALADYDWINALGTTPGGLTIKALRAAMGALKTSQ